MSLYDNPKVVYWIRDPFWGAVNYLTYHALRLSPARAVSAIGSQLGLAAGRYRFRNLTAEADRNLQWIRPDLSPSGRAEIIGKMWDHLGRTIAEMSVIERLWESAVIKKVNEASLLDQLKARRPIIFVYPHLANWELLAIAVQRAGANLSVVYEMLRNRFVRDLAERSRRRLGYRLVTPDGPGIRAIIAALERGETVGIAIDEHKGGNVVAPAFGRPLAAYSNIRYVERLARRFNAPVIPGHCVRTAPLEYTLTCLDPIERASADQLNELCETWVRTYPEQWYMLHRLRALEPALGNEKA